MNYEDLPSVTMTEEVYVTLTPDERVDRWAQLIAKLGVGAYLPIPFYDAARMLVGMRIIPISMKEKEEA